MHDQIGYVLGNARRKQILEMLDKRGVMRLAAVSHLIHMAPMMTERILNELQERKLLERKDDTYRLTEEGKGVLKKITAI